MKKDFRILIGADVACVCNFAAMDQEVANAGYAYARRSEKIIQNWHQYRPISFYYMGWMARRMDNENAKRMVEKTAMAERRRPFTRSLEGMIIAGKLITSEMPILKDQYFNWQTLTMESLNEN